MRPKFAIFTALLLFVGVIAHAQGNVIKPADAKAMIQAYASAQQATLSMAPQDASADAVSVDGIAGPTRRVSVVSDLRSVTYPVAALQLLLAQPGMSLPGAQVRVYKALNRLMQETFVFVAVDSTGRELLGVNEIAIDNGAPCPPFCD